MRYLAHRLLLWAVIGGVPAFLLYRCVNAPLQVTAPNSTGATLVEEPFSVLFEPGKGPGVRMRLDWADTRQAAHTEYFRKNGWSGAPPEHKPGREDLERVGFPYLHLQWPSLHMPPQPLCSGAAGGLKESCPVASIEVSSEPPAEPRTRLMHGETWQWTAFHTRKDGEREEWAGWQCSPERNRKGNREAKAPDAEPRQWALHPLLMQRHCSTPRGFLEKHAGWISGLRENEVLWSCTPAAEGNVRPDAGSCSVSFLHRGRMIRMRVPGSAWEGDAEHQMTALHQLRPQLVEAAWRTLENAAAAGRAGAPAPDWQGALKRELAWCEEYAKRTADLGRTAGEVAAREAWERDHMRVATYDTRGPCTRAFHRVLRAHLAAPEEGKPPALLVDAARKLSDIEVRSSGSLAQPLWALTRDLMARRDGPQSMALLQWRVQQRHKNLEAAEVLAHYDALREQVAKMPAPERLALRVALVRGHDSKGPIAERARDLDWEIARDFVESAGAAALPPEQVLHILLAPAEHARRLPPDDLEARLKLLVPAMQAEAQRISQDAHMMAQHKLVYIATLSLHAAWHANRLAVSASDAPRWKSWLVEHAAWSEAVLPNAPRDWVAGVAAHRDAALRNKTTDHDCPGAALLQCRWGYQPPGLAGVIR